MRKKLYNPQTKCLLYVDREADEKFWDEKWAAAAKETFANPPRRAFTIRKTKQYLPIGAKILEGGCGLGDVVHALDKAGYKTDGIDYAPKVVEAINTHWSHLNVSLGDVRKLDCPENYYDGYWSFGVIEHFSSGYDDIANEMYRVLRPGGFLFLSFPSFTTFRQSRALAGKYEKFSVNPNEITNFYQFALNPSEVRDKFEVLGFKLVDQLGTGSLQGLSEDIKFIRFAKNVFTYFPPRVETAASMAMDIVLGKYAGHSSLLILQKQ